MLIAVPTQGGIHRNPNWVRTKPAPNPNIDVSPRSIAVVMVIVSRDCRDRRSKRRRYDTAQCGSHKV
jgi:hypothetical protein